VKLYWERTVVRCEGVPFFYKVLPSDRKREEGSETPKKSAKGALPSVSRMGRFQTRQPELAHTTFIEE